MRDDGYTLTEALTAIVILGLALGGAAQAVHAIAGSTIRLERGQARLHALAAARDLVASLPDDLGPFVVGTPPSRSSLAGDAHGLRFTCALGETCAMQLSQGGTGTQLQLEQRGRWRRVSLGGVSALHFTYVSALNGATTPAWPPRRAQDRLGAVEIEGAGEVIAVLHLANSEDPACLFDVGAGNCRAPVGVNNARR